MIKALKATHGLFKGTDPVFWILTILSTAYGMVLIASLSRANIGSGKIGGYFLTQLIAITLGYIAAIVISKMDYQAVARYWYIWTAFSVILMIITKFIGWSPDGADSNSWISIGPVNFQPTELVKIFFIVTFAYHSYVLNQNGKIKSFWGALQLFLHACVPILLVFYQGDAGTALVFICMFFIMAFAAGVQARYFLIAFGLAAISAPVLWNILGDYQKQRILCLFDLESSLQMYGWQQYQGKLSIASGQLLGRGLFHGPRVEARIVSVQESDFIFSVAGEELGFIGCLLIIVLLVALCFRCLWIASKSKDVTGKVMCFGFFSMVIIQTILNIGMCLAVMPVIGVTLPFFSSGGSSVACLYLGVGIVQSVYANKFDENTVKMDFKNKY